MSNFMTNEEILQRFDYLLKDHFETVATANDDHTKQVAEVQSRALIAFKDQHYEMYRQYLDAHVGTFPTLRQRYAARAPSVADGEPAAARGTPRRPGGADVDGRGSL